MIEIRERPLGQVVKTPPFHGGNTGSNPVAVIFLCRPSSTGRATDLSSVGWWFKSSGRHIIRLQKWNVILNVVPLYMYRAFWLYYGGVAKWLNAADCKSAPSGFGSSNLSPSTIYIIGLSPSGKAADFGSAIPRF